MISVTFSTKPWRQWMAALIWLPLLGTNGMIHYSIEDLRGAFASPGDLSDTLIGLKVAMAALAVIALLLVPSIVIGGYRLNAPERNFLQDAPLDEIAAVLNRYRAQEADGGAAD